MTAATLSPKTRRVVEVAGALCLAAVMLIGRAGPWMLLVFAMGIILLELIFGFRHRSPVSPYFLMFLTPLLLVKYASVTDFQLRTGIFLLLVYIFAAAPRTRERDIRRWPVSPKPGTVFTVALLILMTGAGILYLRDVHLSGDEPHYLMITQSLVEDGDFDLKNNVENQTYFEFLPVEIRPHLKKQGSRHLSFHMPGMSLLMVPFYMLFNLLGGLVPPALFFRLGAAVINAFFCLALFYFLQRIFPDRRTTGYWLVFIATFPVLFHAVHIYPELPAGTLLMGAFLAVSGGRQKYLIAGILLGILLWLHVKYYPVLLLFLVVAAIRLGREKQWKNLGILILLPVLSGLLLSFYCQSLYGTPFPTGIFPSADYFSIPHAVRLRALAGYFFDQRDGLLFYAPLFFLIFFSFRRRLRHQNLLLGIALVYILSHAFSTVRGAHAPAGRPLMFVSWILIALVMNTIFTWRDRGHNYLSRLLTGLTLFILVWLLIHPLFVYQPVFSHTTRSSSSLLTFLGSDSVSLPGFFPSFLNTGDPPPAANYAWLLFLAGAVVFYYLRPGRFSFRRRGQIFFSYSLFLLLVAVFCIYPHVHLVDENRQVQEGYAFFNNSRNLVYLPEQGIYRARTGNRYHLYFYSTPRRAMEFWVLNGKEAGLVLRNKRRLLFDSIGEKLQETRVDFGNLASVIIHRQKVIPLEIKAMNREDGASFLFFRIRPVR